MAADTIETFITRWAASEGAERANYQLFLTQLCDQLEVPQPEPTKATADENAYVFERDVTFIHSDGSTSIGRIDLYKRGCFVLEAKQGSEQQTADEQAAAVLADSAKKKPAKKKGTAVRGTKAWDDAMVRARGQADRYARALPNSEGWPPFLIVVDVGHSIELYSEFSCSGKTYVPFPDPQSFRIPLAGLADEAIRQRLRTVWQAPQSLDPSRRAAKVTRALSERLAALAKLLEADGHDAALVARFLMRALFTMFAEDVELIPKGSFKSLLASLRDDPTTFVPMVEGLWQAMNGGQFSQYLRQKLLRFNGGLFAEWTALPVNKAMLDLLIDAANSDWTDVEPAIFGTLLERALSPVDRHKLGAHYTPRAYVERLVLPTVIEPLRDEWNTTYAAALAHAAGGQIEAAQKLIRDFHHDLCETRVLDPACGSGNFLYVTLEQMKRLEGEVLNALRELGDQQAVLIEVDPHQFLGIEISPRAAAIAELVLWIGHLQWHFRTRGHAALAEPIIKNYKNIECRDAVLAWDRTEPLLDEDNKPVTRWDGRTTKPHPVTGEEVPDETARVMVLKYINPRKAEWPKADYVVGNPPFLGKHFLLNDLGDGYVAALRAVYDNEVPDSADFVMYWWYIASTFARANSIRRFGFVTTNSITQAFNRRILQRAFSDDPPIGLRFAIADHPWVKSEDGAAVRIAMTVGSRLDGRSLLGIVLQENETGGEDALNVELGYREGRINPDLTIGSDVTTAQALIANSGLTSNGVMLGGRGFLVLPDDEWSLNAAIVHPICNGNDVLQRSRCAKVIDFFGYEVDAAKRSSPEAFQRILDRVKPERDANRRASRRERWWLFSEVMPQLRRITANLTRFIATPETSKHRMFVFLPQGTLAEHPLIAIGLHDAYFLGVLSSRTHLVWALASGGTLEDRPRYNKSVCFNPFAFPACEENRKVGIRDLGEQLDAHRKRQQALHPKLTLTDMYNVLEKLRAGEELTDKDKVIHDQGLVSVLRQIHDDLDAAVFEAYGWPPTLADEEILQRLVELNAERAAEEARGIVRWLRPDFQQQSDSKTQRGLDLAGRAEPAEPAAATPSAKKSGKLPWPAEQAQRTKAIQAALAASPSAATAEEIAKRFLRANSTQVEEILAALASLGMARQVNGEYLPP